jgi:hypothetical protein
VELKCLKSAEKDKTGLWRGFYFQPVLPDGNFFQTKNTNLGKFWKDLQWKMFGIYRAILSILRPNGIFYVHLVHFVVMWYIFTRFGMLYREKSGNPVSNQKKVAFPSDGTKRKKELLKMNKFCRHGYVRQRGLLMTLLYFLGLPDGIFSYENPNLGILWRVLEWKVLVYFIALWYILRSLDKFDVHLEYFLSVGIFWAVLVCFDKKNLAALVHGVLMSIHVTVETEIFEPQIKKQRLCLKKLRPALAAWCTWS